MRDLTQAQRMERSLSKRFRRELWNPFIAAMKRYEMVRAGDHVRVLIQGKPGDFVLAKLLQLLQQHSDVPFEVTYRYTGTEGAATIQKLAEDWAIQLQPLYDEDTIPDSKIATGEHLDDAVEALLCHMFYDGRVQGILPVAWTEEGVTCIRPLFCIKEKDIQAFYRYNGLQTWMETMDARRTPEQEKIHLLVKELSQENPGLEDNLFAALQDVHLDTMIAWEREEKRFSFLDQYG